MEINLTGVSAAEQQTQTTTFKRVEPGIHTVTITKVEGGKAGDKDILKTTFSSKEAEAEFSHNFFLTEKALPSLQYLITKFTGGALEGKFTVEALSAALVGKTQTIVVDGRIVPKNKDDKWYNNVYTQLRFAGYVLDDPSTYVHKEGDPNGYRIDRRQEMNLDAVNNPSTETTSVAEDNDLPF